ncbi:hypothetical protein I3760_09G079100 [Carya illinoinensis]|nr:hypothetical protein I3760_09G079100 [Carya illinoinensis]
MAPKRQSHLDDPPAASSSEEEVASSEEEEEEHEDEEEGSASTEEEEAEPTKTSSLPSTPVSDKKAPSKKPDPPLTKPQSSSSGSGSESESESDSGGTPNPTVKPIASKPMEDAAPKATTKPRSKPSSTTPARSVATKRPNNETDIKDSSKRAKKKAPEPNTDGVVSPGDSKKSAGEEKKLFQRLWSEDDEIAVLKGVLDYTEKRGADPSTDAAAFHEFVKKSLHVDVSKNQLMDKIRRLRKKYKNNAGRGKKGKEPTFSKPHEQKAYELSKKIWGPAEGTAGGGLIGDAKSNGKAASRKNNQKVNTGRSLKDELLAVSPIANKEVEKMDIDGNPGLGLDSLRSLDEVFRFDKNMSVAGLEEGVIKRGLELIGKDKRAELEERWKEVQMAELEVFVKRTELIRDQARLILEAYKAAAANDH